MYRFSSYNKIYLLYKYSMYIHHDNNDNFILVNTSNIHFNPFDYLTVQFLYSHNYSTNVYYYYHHIYKCAFYGNIAIRQLKIYQEVQKFKLAFSRFIHLAKLKIKKKYNHVNLCLQPFRRTPIQICENNFVYSFDDLELFHMMEACFNYETYDVPTILKLKNPYTNVPFKLHHLIYIYFELLRRGKNSLFFTLYFKNNFSKKAVISQYEANLYVHCIKKKYHQLSTERKFLNLLRIFRAFPKYNSFRNIRVGLLQKLFGSLSEPFFIYRNLKNIGIDNDSFLELYEDKIRGRLEYVYEKNPILGRKIFTKSIGTGFDSYINEDTLNIIR